jgi:hypothetical protein
VLGVAGQLGPSLSKESIILLTTFIDLPPQHIILLHNRVYLDIASTFRIIGLEPRNSVAKNNPSTEKPSSAVHQIAKEPWNRRR